MSEENKPDRIPFERLKAIQSLLAERYPAVFGNVRQPKPLAIGTREKLIAVIEELGVTRREIIVAVKLWTGRLAYQRALAAGGVRYNLDGTENGEIPESHQTIAKTRIGEIEAKLAERRANQDPQKKPGSRNRRRPQNSDQSTDSREKPEAAAEQPATQSDAGQSTQPSAVAAQSDSSQKTEHSEQRSGKDHNANKKPRDRFPSKRPQKSAQNQSNHDKPRGNGRHKPRRDRNRNQKPGTEKPASTPAVAANSLAAQLGGNASSLAELQSLLKENSTAKKGQ